MASDFSYFAIFRYLVLPVREYLARIGDCTQMVLPFSLRLQVLTNQFPVFSRPLPQLGDGAVPVLCFEQREKMLLRWGEDGQMEACGTERQRCCPTRSCNVRDRTESTPIE